MIPRYIDRQPSIPGVINVQEMRPPTPEKYPYSAMYGASRAILLAFLVLCLGESIPGETHPSKGEKLVDTVIPITPATGEAFKRINQHRGKDISDLLESAGITFPEGAFSRYDHRQGLLFLRLEHSQALQATKVLASLIDEPSDEVLTSFHAAIQESRLRGNTASSGERSIRGESRFPSYDFCIAYILGDSEEQDARPRDESDPFEGSSASRSLLSLDKGIDMAALVSRATHQRILAAPAIERLKDCVFKSSSTTPTMDCYEPHHLFVFYTSTGQAVAGIEVCFTCSRVKLFPPIKDTLDDTGNETSDLLALAHLLEEHGLSLSPYTSAKAYGEILVERTQGAHDESTKD